MYVFVLFYDIVFGISGRKLYIQTFTMFLLVGLASVISLKNQKYIEQILPGLLFGSIVTYTVLYLLIEIQTLGLEYNRDILSETKFNTITLSRIIGIIVLGTFFQFIIAKKFVLKILSILIVLVSVYYVFILGTRGVFVSIVFSLAVYFAVQIKESNTRKYFILVLVSIIVVSVAFNLEQFSLFQRLGSVTNFKGQSRFILWYYSIREFLSNPFIPLGPGGFMSIYKTYPHNFFLELLVDYGFITLIVIPYFVIYGIRKSIQIIKNDNISIAIKIVPVLWLYYFMNTMFSGDILVNEVWFRISFLLIAVIEHVKLDQRKMINKEKLTTSYMHKPTP